MSNKNRNIGLNFIGIPLADLEWDKNNGLHYSLRPDFIKNQTRCQWDLALDPKKQKIGTATETIHWTIHLQLMLVMGGKERLFDTPVEVSYNDFDFFHRKRNLGI